MPNKKIKKLKEEEVYFSFDKETAKIVKEIGYIPKDCWCTTKDAFIPEHAIKNRKIVENELKKCRQ